MKGTYRFYQNGMLLGKSENLLTTAGKRAILRYLAGRGGTIGASIALGTGVTPATVDDKRLTFEADRVTIDIISVLYNNSYIVFKGTIPQEITYTIYETGLFNQPTNPYNLGSSRLLASFETGAEEWTGGTLSSSNARIGSQTLRLAPAANGTLEASVSSIADFSNFSPDDNFTVAFTKNSANASSLILKFKNLAGDQFSLSKSISGLANGYNIVTFRKGDFAPTGAISWDAIEVMAVATSAGAGGGSDIYLDGIRAEDDDNTNTDYALVSRSVLAQPIVKTTAAPMDVEYALELNFA